MSPASLILKLVICMLMSVALARRAHWNYTVTPCETPSETVILAVNASLRLDKSNNAKAANISFKMKAAQDFEGIQKVSIVDKIALAHGGKAVRKFDLDLNILSTPKVVSKGVKRFKLVFDGSDYKDVYDEIRKNTKEMVVHVRDGKKLLVCAKLVRCLKEMNVTWQAHRKRKDATTSALKDESKSASKTDDKATTSSSDNDSAAGAKTEASAAKTEAPAAKTEAAGAKTEASVAAKPASADQ